MITPQAALEDLASLELDGEAERLYLEDNASRVFGIARESVPVSDATETVPGDRR
jgi:predicted TIM-barrel fold metal-dependent hydrolase